MNIAAFIVIAIPTIVLAVVIVLLVRNIAHNVKVGRLVREQLANRISQLRLDRMLKHEKIDKNVLLHRVALAEIEQEMRQCQSCQHTEACDKALAKQDAANEDVSFCPNIAVIHQHKMAL